jgi:hypothetical protein
MIRIRTVLVLASALLLLAALIVPARGQVGETCAPIWVGIQAQLSEVTCFEIGSGTACYGHRQLQVERPPLELPPSPFEQPGQTAALSELSAIRTAALDPVTGDYGIGVLKVELADAILGAGGGTAVTFILYGDTNLESAPADQSEQASFSAFYFNTGGVGARRCIEASEETLPSGLYIESPEGTRVTFTANGVDVSIGSAVVLEAEPNAEMTISVIEGSAEITVPGFPAQTAAFMQRIRVPLGGANGLTASGAPSEPEPLPANFMTMVLPVCQIATWAGSESLCPLLAGMDTAQACFVYPMTALDVRSGPGALYASLGMAVSDSALRAIARTPGIDGLGWYEIENFNGLSGWVQMGAVRAEGDCAGLPQPAVVPPLPTPTPTPVPRFADLTVTVAANGCTGLRDSCTVSVIVTNNGDAGSAPFAITVDVSGAGVAAPVQLQQVSPAAVREGYTLSFGALPVGGTFVATQPISTACARVGCRVIVTADSGQQVIEWNEANNQYQTNITPIGSPRP